MSSSNVFQCGNRKLLRCVLLLLLARKQVVVNIGCRRIISHNRFNAGSALGMSSVGVSESPTMPNQLLGEEVEGGISVPGICAFGQLASMFLPSWPPLIFVTLVVLPLNSLLY